MIYNRDTSSVLKTCHSVIVDPEVEQNAAIMRVPVVLAETCIEAFLVAKIQFPEPVLDIIKIKKQLSLTQCKLLLPSNKLYIKGFVRKNIQYTTPIFPINPSTTLHSTLRSFTIDVPFTCVTKLKFLVEPTPLTFSDRKEFGFWINPNLATQGSKEYQSTSTFSQRSQEFNNEPPYCELLSSRINEWDQVGHPQPLPGGGTCEETFACIEELMVLQFVIQIIQRQNIQSLLPKPKRRPFPMGEESVEDLFKDSIEDSLEEAFEKFFKGSTKGKKTFEDDVPFSVESSVEDSAQEMFDELINRPINQSFKEFYDKKRHEHSSGNPIGELEEGSDSIEGSFEKFFKSSFLELEESNQSSNGFFNEPIEASFDRFFKPSSKGAIPRSKELTMEGSNVDWDLDSTKELFVDSEEQWEKDSTKESFEDSNEQWDKDSTKDSLEDSLESFDIDLLDE